MTLSRYRTKRGIPQSEWSSGPGEPTIAPRDKETRVSNRHSLLAICMEQVNHDAKIGATGAGYKPRGLTGSRKRPVRGESFTNNIYGWSRNLRRAAARNMMHQRWSEQTV